jgi:hypothetical protein
MESSTASRARERQLWLELADALERAQAALLEHDLGSFQACTQAQQLCWREISAIPADATRIEDRELIDVRRRVRHLSRMERALLRRALHSLLILRNLNSLDPAGKAGSNSGGPEG